jgi:hypothetical protein
VLTVAYWLRSALAASANELGVYGSIFRSLPTVDTHRTEVSKQWLLVRPSLAFTVLPCRPLSICRPPREG